MKIRKSHVAGCIATLMLPCCAYARSHSWWRTAFQVREYTQQTLGRGINISGSAGWIPSPGHTGRMEMKGA